MSNGIFDNTIETLSKSLDLYLTRQTVISDNIANAETPGFKARRVEFESELQRAVENMEAGVSESDVNNVTPSVVADPNSELGQDLNTVDMDREMSELTKTELKYSATTQAINRKFALLRYAITEGSDR